MLVRYHLKVQVGSLKRETKSHNQLHPREKCRLEDYFSFWNRSLFSMEKGHSLIVDLSDILWFVEGDFLISTIVNHN